MQVTYVARDRAARGCRWSACASGRVTAAALGTATSLSCTLGCERARVQSVVACVWGSEFMVSVEN